MSFISLLRTVTVFLQVLPLVVISNALPWRNQDLEPAGDTTVSFEKALQRPYDSAQLIPPQPALYAQGKGVLGGAPSYQMKLQCSQKEVIRSLAASGQKGNLSAPTA